MSKISKGICCISLLNFFEGINFFDCNRYVVGSAGPSPFGPLGARPLRVSASESSPSEGVSGRSQLVGKSLESNTTTASSTVPVIHQDGSVEYQLASDGNGVADGYAVVTLEDGTTFHALDADNNGVPDGYLQVARADGSVFHVHGDTSPTGYQQFFIIDSDGNMVPFYSPEANSDGIADHIPTGYSSHTIFVENGSKGTFYSLDADGDGVADNIPTGYHAYTVVNSDGHMSTFYSQDVNGDGIADSVPSGHSPHVMVNSDGELDMFYSPDENGDNVPDHIPEGTIQAADGNYINPTHLENGYVQNEDGEYIRQELVRYEYIRVTENGDTESFYSTDIDGDGVADDSPEGYIKAEDGRYIHPDHSHNGYTADGRLDTDNDGVPNTIDNAPDISNPGQEDLDGDGIGDVADSDIDGDGVVNTSDNAPTIVNPGQADLDNDGIGDVADPDIDGDGVLNTEDAFPYDPSESVDVDNDGVGANSEVIDTIPTELGDAVDIAAELGLNTAEVLLTWYMHQKKHWKVKKQSDAFGQIESYYTSLGHVTKSQLEDPNNASARKTVIKAFKHMAPIVECMPGWIKAGFLPDSPEQALLQMLKRHLEISHSTNDPGKPEATVDLSSLMRDLRILGLRPEALDLETFSDNLCLTLNKETLYTVKRELAPLGITLHLEKTKIKGMPNRYRYLTGVKVAIDNAKFSKALHQKAVSQDALMAMFKAVHHSKNQTIVKQCASFKPYFSEKLTSTGRDATLFAVSGAFSTLPLFGLGEYMRSGVYSNKLRRECGRQGKVSTNIDQALLKFKDLNDEDLTDLLTHLLETKNVHKTIKKGLAGTNAGIHVATGISDTVGCALVIGKPFQTIVTSASKAGAKLAAAGTAMGARWSNDKALRRTGHYVKANDVFLHIQESYKGRANQDSIKEVTRHLFGLTADQMKILWDDPSMVQTGMLKLTVQKNKIAGKSVEWDDVPSVVFQEDEVVDKENLEESFSVDEDVPGPSLTSKWRQVKASLDSSLLDLVGSDVHLDDVQLDSVSAASIGDQSASSMEMSDVVVALMAYNRFKATLSTEKPDQRELCAVASALGTYNRHKVMDPKRSDQKELCDVAAALVAYNRFKESDPLFVTKEVSREEDEPYVPVMSSSPYHSDSRSALPTTAVLDGHSIVSTPL